jgi:hypothetical protein
MSESILPIVATGIVGALSGILGTYALARHTFSDDKILEKVDLLLSEVAQNEEMQKKVYLVGGILGKGIRDGTGIANLVPGSGKRKGGLEGIVMELIGGFIGNQFKGQGQGQEQREEPRQIEQKW